MCDYVSQITDRKIGWHTLIFRMPEEIRKHVTTMLRGNHILSSYGQQELNRPIRLDRRYPSENPRSRPGGPKRQMPHASRLPKGFERELRDLLVGDHPRTADLQVGLAVEQRFDRRLGKIRSGNWVDASVAGAEHEYVTLPRE